MRVSAGTPNEGQDCQVPDLSGRQERIDRGPGKDETLGGTRVPSAVHMDALQKQ